MQLQPNGLTGDGSLDHHERLAWLHQRTVRHGIPQERLDRLKLVEQSLQVKPEVVGLLPSVLGTADDFTGPQIHRDLPTIFHKLALKTNTCFAAKGFKQVGHLIDKGADRVREGNYQILAATSFQTFDEMPNHQM